jgi:multidrug efflux pump subunit AcrA (membrane-fusion protein)
VALPVALVAGMAFGEEYSSDTIPSEDKTLTFVRSGRVDEVLVKEGDKVDPNQPLVRLDDKAERAQIDQLKAQAENTTRVRAANAQQKQKINDLQQLKDAFKKGAASELEVQHAELEVTIAELSKELAEFQVQQDKRKYREARLQLERMELRSDMEGFVQEVFLKENESAEPYQKVIRIVSIDPLWIEVHVPVDQARELKVDSSDGEKVPEASRAMVRFEDRKSKAVQGRVIHKSLVARGTIPRTLMIRVEIANPNYRPAGERVKVGFPALDDSVAEGASSSSSGQAKTQSNTQTDSEEEESHG